MSTRFPATGIDDGTTLPNPATTDKRNSPSHAGLHANANDAIKAVETKLGTGSSAPASSTLLFGTGAGTSAWQGLTSAQLAAVLSDETGTGSAVFATTPTLVTPKVDTINESTLNNGVTVAGMNVKAGVISNPATAIGTNGVSAAMLSTTAITLASISSSTSQSGISTTDVLVTGLATTVTIPAGGRRVRIEAYIPRVFGTAISSPTISIYNSATVTGTPVQSAQLLLAIANNGMIMTTFYEHTPAAGSQSYCVSLKIDAGSGSTVLTATSQAFLTVRVM